MQQQQPGVLAAAQPVVLVHIVAALRVLRVASAGGWRWAAAAGSSAPQEEAMLLG